MVALAGNVNGPKKVVIAKICAAKYKTLTGIFILFITYINTHRNRGVFLFIW